jgi:hypothetical protein
MMSLAVDELSVDELSGDELSVNLLSPHRIFDCMAQYYNFLVVVYEFS